MAALLTCPQCQSHDLRPSHRRPLDAPLALFGLHPYRCRNCNHRFYRRDAGTAEAFRNGDSELKRILSELPPLADGVLDMAKPAEEPSEANAPKADLPEAEVPDADAPSVVGPVAPIDVLKDYSVKPRAGTSKADSDDFPDDYPWDHKWSREE